MQKIQIASKGRVYSINNNSNKYDRAHKLAGTKASNEAVLVYYDKLAGLILDEKGNKIETKTFWKPYEQRIEKQDKRKRVLKSLWVFFNKPIVVAVIACAITFLLTSLIPTRETETL